MSRNVLVGILLVVLGVLLSLGLHLLLHAYAKLLVPRPNNNAIWFSVLRPILAAVMQVLPAFLVGWLARRRGFLLGALVGATSALIIAAFFNVAWHNVSLSPFDWFLVSYFLALALSSAVVSSVAGAAGEFACSRLPSNYSFQRTLIR